MLRKERQAEKNIIKTFRSRTVVIEYSNTTSDCFPSEICQKHVLRFLAMEYKYLLCLSSLFKLRVP